MKYRINGVRFVSWKLLLVVVLHSVPRTYVIIMVRLEAKGSRIDDLRFVTVAILIKSLMQLRAKSKFHVTNIGLFHVKRESIQSGTGNLAR